jgi:hypothetical protein
MPLTNETLDTEVVTTKTENRLAQFSKAITDQAIAKMRASYLPLKIVDVKDTAGAAVVHQARMEVKNKRCEVEKVRKALKADSLEYGRKVDAEAKRITALLLPIEEHLDAQESIFEAEKERIRKEQLAKAEAAVKAKREAEEALIRAEQAKEEARLKAIRDAEEARLKAEADRLAEERKAFEEKQAAAAAEARKVREAEEARLRAIAEENARQARAEQEKLAAEARKLQEERERLAKIEADRLRAIEDERIRKEAAERAIKAEQERVAREAAEAKRRAEEEAEAKRRAEAARPTVEKLLSLANVVASVPHPGLDEALDLRIRRVLNGAANEIREIAAEIGG